MADEPQNRSKTGQFLPGSPSGNPGGRPKLALNVREIAQRHTDDAIKTLADIMFNGAKDSDRAYCAVALLDRACGKPVQALDVTHHDDGADAVRATLERMQANPLTAAALLTLAEASAKSN